MKPKIRLKACKIPTGADFYVFVSPQRSENTADMLSALHTVPKVSKYVIDAFRTEYKTILCESNPKLG